MRIIFSFFFLKRIENETKILFLSNSKFLLFFIVPFKFKQFYLEIVRNSRSCKLRIGWQFSQWRTFDLHYHPLRSSTNSIDFFRSSIDVKKIVINCDRKVLLRNKSTGSRKNLDNRGGSSFCWLSYYAEPRR